MPSTATKSQASTRFDVRAISWTVNLFKDLVNLLFYELQTTGLTAQDCEESLVDFLCTPYWLEQFLLFGTAVCLDSFLYILTILPLRFLYALGTLLWKRKLVTSRRGDLVKGFILGFSLLLLLRVNTSKVYHTIRGGSGLTLYLIYNVLDVADNFCGSLGQDILETLVSLPTTISITRTSTFGVLMFVQCVVHSFVLVLLLITLNVAVNSYSNVLLTLTVSNQFSKLKAAVFKKFEKETLFQLVCTDLTQRFQIGLMLLVIVLRNLVEMQGGFAPVKNMLSPISMVLASMVLVDWIKHCYITRYNNFRPLPLYTKYLSVLMADYVENRQISSNHLMMKRAGLPVLPLAIVFLRMVVKLRAATTINLILLFVFLLLSKLFLGLYLHRLTLDFKERRAIANATKRDRDSKKEHAYLEQVTRYSHPQRN